ncbi:MAG: HRDC domain-containing protein [Spirochaetales bacterium]|nr:HRDC domain-containing protein [Candidatus Physcosoma equi]
MIYTTLDTDEKIIQQCRKWEDFPRIAVDFEGEFNLHIYGEHLCLVQIYDGEGYYIIDPRSGRVSPEGLKVFFSLPTEKLWFDCQGDASLVYKVYGLRINNIYDVRVLALALGYTGNLLGLEKAYLGVELEINKKKNQQANWLKRPIDMELMEYALLDVKYLFDLKDVLLPIVVKEGLEAQVLDQLQKVQNVKEPTPGWKNICNWKLLNRRERVFIRQIFIARDQIARRFNVPAARVMDKHKIIDLAKNPPKNKESLRVRIATEPPRFRALLLDQVWKAIETAQSESAKEN